MLMQVERGFFSQEIPYDKKNSVFTGTLMLLNKIVQKSVLERKICFAN